MLDANWHSDPQAALFSHAELWFFFLGAVMSGCSTSDGQPGAKHSSKVGGSMDLTHMKPRCGAASQGQDQVWRQWSGSDTVQGCASL